MCLMEEDLLDVMEKEVGKVMEQVVKVMGVEGCEHDGGGCDYDARWRSTENKCLVSIFLVRATKILVP